MIGHHFEVHLKKTQTHSTIDPTRWRHHQPVLVPPKVAHWARHPSPHDMQYRNTQMQYEKGAKNTRLGCFFSTLSQVQEYEGAAGGRGHVWLGQG
mmetsp:Transcript_150606/g.263220  ORF Transcript_150606/g.263220 Transcript_150606/m.263220 type:complete len:95 (-) Transcript_150606:1353-1637(-)